MGKAAPASLANVLPAQKPALKSRKMINHDVRNLKRETVEQVDKRKVSQNCIITVWESLSRMYKKRMMEWIRGMDGLRNSQVHWGDWRCCSNVSMNLT